MTDIIALLEEARDNIRHPCDKYLAHTNCIGCSLESRLDSAIAEIKAAKPVAWTCFSANANWMYRRTDPQSADWTPLYAAPTNAPVEPKAGLCVCGKVIANPVSDDARDAAHWRDMFVRAMEYMKPDAWENDQEAAELCAAHSDLLAEKDATMRGKP